MVKATLYPLSKKISCSKGESFVWLVLYSLNYVKPGTQDSRDLPLTPAQVQAEFRYLSWLNYSCHSLTYVDALPSVPFHVRTQPEPKLPSFELL